MIPSSEIVRTVRVPNPAGLHARPCQSIAAIVQSHQATVHIACDGVDVDARSILELMTLCAPCEATLTLRAHGADAEEVCRRIVLLVESGFGETD